ncbi:MAG: FAD binding domain-containing protein [Spirochaetales bacterium]
MQDDVQVFSATTLNEVLSRLKNISNLSILAGTTLCKKQLRNVKIILPSSCIFVGKIYELREINRSERFIEFGSSVTLNQILSLGKARIPHFFYDALLSVASHSIRNLATLGGNICSTNHKMTLYAPLLAMDAELELKNFSETRHIVMTKFTGIPKGFLLTKIRIPTPDWQTAEFFKIGSPFKKNETCASYTFLANVSRGILDDVRIAFCGPIALRSRETENAVISSRLPLSERDILLLTEKTAQLYDEECEKSHKIIDPLLKQQFLNLLAQSLKALK